MHHAQKPARKTGYELGVAMSSGDASFRIIDFDDPGLAQNRALYGVAKGKGLMHAR